MGVEDVQGDEHDDQEPDPSRENVPVAPTEEEHRLIGTGLLKNYLRTRSVGRYGSSTTIVPSTTRTG